MKRLFVALAGSSPMNLHDKTVCVQGLRQSDNK